MYIFIYDMLYLSTLSLDMPIYDEINHPTDKKSSYMISSYSNYIQSIEPLNHPTDKKSSYIVSSYLDYIQSII